MGSGTSLVSEVGMLNGCPMDIYWTGELDRTGGQAWSVRVGCGMDVYWTGRTIPSGQRILMANLDSVGRTTSSITDCVRNIELQSPSVDVRNSTILQYALSIVSNLVLSPEPTY